MNPKNGRILAMLNFPSYDNNVFATPSLKQERVALLTDSHRPLFNRAISGLYNPASTIKPVVGVAALAEQVIDPVRSIFSPGYIDVPNPYHPESPTRYLDWRYQGYVNLSQAIAKSSDVYFSAVVGGTPEIKGMGITKLRDWWQRFGLGSVTGIDLPGEESGFLPDPAWKEKRMGRAWTLGDSYNVAIGQGDVLATPLQIINYEAAIANGGHLWRPHISEVQSKPEMLNDLTAYASQILEARKGMREAVTSPEGTAYLLHDLPVAAGGKTGTAQTKNKTEENSFTVAFAPYDDPQIVVLVVIENARAKTLNTVPVAKDVLWWYAINRLGAGGHKGTQNNSQQPLPSDTASSTASSTPVEQ
jgi:penicillin-binding protein 2